MRRSISTRRGYGGRRASCWGRRSSPCSPSLRNGATTYCTWCSKSSNGKNAAPCVLPSVHECARNKEEHVNGTSMLFGDRFWALRQSLTCHLAGLSKGSAHPAGDV